MKPATALIPEASPLGSPNEKTAQEKASLPSPSPASQREPKRGRKTAEDRLAKLIADQTALNTQLDAVRAQIRIEEQKRQAQIDRLIAAACRSDKRTHATVRAALDAYVRDPKQRALLKSEGWLD